MSSPGAETRLAFGICRDYRAMGAGNEIFGADHRQKIFRNLSARYEGVAQLAADAIKTVSRALEKGFAEKGEKVAVWAYKSDYKDFIRMYVVSDYFKNMSDKERLGEIYSLLDSYGAKALVGKISLCIAMTTREYDEEFGGDVWLGNIGEVYRSQERRPKVRRLARLHGRN